MSGAINRQWLLARRPEGGVVVEDFRRVDGPIPEPGDGEVLVRVLYFGFDASQRIWLTDHGGYLPPIQIGEPMRTMAIGQIVTSRHPDYQVGDLVEGFMSWQDYILARADGPMPLRVLPKADFPITWNMSVLGVSGLTAYFGVTDVLKVGPGDTVFVSAATGATGSLVAAICKTMGAKTVIGSAGGPEKCRWIVEQAGYDAAIDYLNDDLDASLSRLCPDGVNVYFDNVGGDMLDSVLLHMAPMGRVLICGAMSSGYTDAEVPGPQKNFMQICVKMLRVQGILLLFYRDQLEEGAQQMAAWIREGRLHVEENIIEDFEQAPALLATMFTGKAPGKLILKIGDPE
jgi:NADPH-dependent curcumin reductase CurA